MSPKILIMGASKQQNRDTRPMPSLMRYDSLRWQVLRDIFLQAGTPLYGTRVLVLTPKWGFISVSQPIEYDEYVWTSSTWRKDLPKVHASYDRVLRPRIDPGSNIFVSADALHQTVMNACGLQQDVVSRGASLIAPANTHGIAIQQLREWILGG